MFFFCDLSLRFFFSFFFGFFFLFVRYSWRNIQAKIDLPP